MITSKQRAYLRSMAAGIRPVFQIGKGGITDVLTEQLGLALEARELIKVSILENAGIDAKTACGELAARLGAEPVQVIGFRFVLYRQASEKKNRKIELPKVQGKR